MEEASYTPSKANSPKYQLLMELGKGGMGVVHLAMSRGPQGFTKLLVLKIMRRELLGEPELLQMFLEEARISARLAHPNIVHVFEVGEHEGCPCIVMEYLEGQPLSSMLVRAPEKPPLPLHLQVLAKALAGLHAAHELRDYDGTSLKLVHRDVSPHNLFVLFDGQVKVLDFGIAKAVGSEVETRTGSPKGKIRYMSPEQLIRDPLDRRADVFSVGVLMWEALARRRMWGEMEEGEVTRALLNQRIPPLPEGDHIPAELRAICARALAPDPADRYPTRRGVSARPREVSAGPARAVRRRGAGRVPAHAVRRAAAGDQEAHRLSHQVGAAEPELDRQHAEHARRRPAVPRIPGGPARARSPRWRCRRRAMPDRRRPPATRRPRAYPPPAAAALDPSAVTVTPTPAQVASLESPGGRRRDRRLAGVPARGRELPARRHDPTPRRSAPTRRRPRWARRARRRCRPVVPGFKLCGSECVSIDRPDFGCGGESCQSCRVFNATARCNLKHECDLRDLLPVVRRLRRRFAQRMRDRSAHRSRSLRHLLAQVSRDGARAARVRRHLHDLALRKRLRRLQRRRGRRLRGEHPDRRRELRALRGRLRAGTEVPARRVREVTR